MLMPNPRAPKSSRPIMRLPSVINRDPHPHNLGPFKNLETTGTPCSIIPAPTHHVDDAGQHLGGVEAGSRNVQVKLANADAQPVRPQVAQTQDTAAIGDDDGMNVILGVECNGVGWWGGDGVAGGRVLRVVGDEGVGVWGVRVACGEQGFRP